MIVSPSSAPRKAAATDVSGYQAVIASVSNDGSQFNTALNLTGQGVYFNQISCSDINNCWSVFPSLSSSIILLFISQSFFSSSLHLFIIFISPSFDLFISSSLRFFIPLNKPTNNKKGRGRGNQQDQRIRFVFLPPFILLFCK